MTQSIRGVLSKMHAELRSNQPVNYTLPVGDTLVSLNSLIGQSITLTHTGNIFCCHCGRKTKKSYSQGHCYVCMTQLASCDLCIMKPETCHFDQGTCREPDWAIKHCMTDHYVYLANTSGLKVGITRHTQIPTRWIDQGATQALPIIRVTSRKLSGLIEIALAQFIADKTNWRALLKGEASSVNLADAKRTLLPKIQQALRDIIAVEGSDAITVLDDNTPVTIAYPVTAYPGKIVSHNFDKNPVVSGKLVGIKGQYLILDSGVINIRKFTSYEIEFSADQ